jgi:hypothetical protein
MLPIDPAANRLGRQAVGQALGELEQVHQGKPPGCLRRTAAGGEQTRKPGIVEHRAELVAQARVAAAFWKRSAGNAHGLLEDGWGDFGAKGHDADLGQDIATSPSTSTSPPGFSAKPLRRIRQQINRARGEHHYDKEIRHLTATWGDAQALFP